MQVDRSNAFVAFLVWAITLIVYTMTMAPTLSFWDCGEFIAVSHILGIPHPPGTPLYVLVGRIFSIIPLFEDISARVNFLSVLTNSFTALFGYLIAVRILRSWITNDEKPNLFLIYGGAASGAFFLAFGLTQWNNSVEAEVYGMAMMFFTAIFWLCQIYFEHRGTLFADRLMILIVYIAVLGVSVHMTIMLALPIAALFFILKKETPTRIWFLIAIFLLFELFLMFAFSSRAGEIPYTVPVAIVFTFFLFYMLSFEQISRFSIIVAAGFVLSLMPLFASGLSVSSNAVLFVGAGSFIAIFLYSCYRLFFWYGNRKRRDSSLDAEAASALFVVAAGLMSGIVLIDAMRGYGLFLFVSAILTAGLLIYVWRYLRFSIVIALVVVGLLMIGVKQFAFGVVGAALFIFILGRFFRLPDWKSAMIILLVAVAGFSVHLFIPIRAGQQPAINENNPAVSIADMIKDPVGSIQPVIGFIERKQYGNQSMLQRMFSRRAEWKSQFGIHSRMGFWSFFNKQYGLTGTKFFILLVFGIFGIWEAIRRRPEFGLPLAMLIILSSIGLILYMNFADGSRQLSSGSDYLEVRDRDYFFTPAFILFGLSIGMGIYAIILFIRESISNLAPRIQKFGTVALSGLFLLPLASLKGNLFECDRSRNYIPFDYASNLLASVDKGGVLFTNGDNDTFPLWCLQEVYGIRTDVINVNLSLANTHWYIKQIRDHMGLKLGWSDEEILALRPFRYRDGRVIRIQDQVIDAIVDNNDVPINFSVTCGASARKLHGYQIDSLLELSGLKFRLLKSGTSLTVNLEECLEFLMDTSIIKARGTADPTIYKDAASIRTTNNIAASYLTMSDTLRLAGDFDRAEEVIRFSLKLFPFVSSSQYALAYILADRGKLTELASLLDTLSGSFNQDPLVVALARGYRQNDEHDKAEQLLKSSLVEKPGSRTIFDELMRLYVQSGDISNIKSALREWLVHNPGDREIGQFLKEFESGRLFPENKNSDK